ncbi:hypothetical protein FB451DRAFT_286021 [Mycena latifolia]|nr:hypothetical protein FB451DRAFT_286021 [Mycena latifolia]
MFSPSQASPSADWIELPDEFQHHPPGSSPKLGSPLSEMSETPSEDDSLMDWSSPSQGSSTSPLKRKRFILDHVPLSPLSALDSTRIPTASPDDPSPNKKVRQSQATTPRRDLRRNSGEQRISEPLETEEREFSEAAMSPSPDSPSERDPFVADLENCLDSILNELAEETQRREALQEMYASGSFSGSVTSYTADEGFPFSFSDDSAPDMFFDSYDDGSDDELSQNLFENPHGSHLYIQISADCMTVVRTLDPQETWLQPSNPDSQLDTKLDSKSIDDAVADDQLPISFSRFFITENEVPFNNPLSTSLPIDTYDPDASRVLDKRKSHALEPDAETWPWAEAGDDRMDVPTSPADSDSYSDFDSTHVFLFIQSLQPLPDGMVQCRSCTEPLSVQPVFSQGTNAS